MGVSVSAPAATDTGYDHRNPIENVHLLLSQKPLKMASMLRVSRIINDTPNVDKHIFVHKGVIARILDMIAELAGHSNSYSASLSSKNSKKKIDNGLAIKDIQQGKVKGVGYGSGSTKSKWDMERAQEDRLAREEQLIWLLNALVSFLFHASPDFGDPSLLLMRASHLDAHITARFIELIKESACSTLLRDHLKNESIYDVSEHTELYQAFLELACCMSLYKPLLNLLSTSTDGNSSVADQVPHFDMLVQNFVQVSKMHMGSPDFRLVDFAHKVSQWNEMVRAALVFHHINLRRQHRSTSLPVDVQNQMATSSTRVSSAQSTSTGAEPIKPNELYVKALRDIQVTTARYHGDYGKLVVPFTYRKEARNINPFTSTMSERTKRIAKEVATLQTALPLARSNAIFVAVDESRCDIMKVLISGPDDTPYQNGLFEFDVFFPSSYPFSPPKVNMVTTGGGTVRFNPNIYPDGKICLSILGSWEGRPEEKWTPYCSILQVLVSIQGLIFVREPYFNEPGYEKLSGTEKGNEYSRLYNDHVTQATMQYAIKEQLKNPPAHFADVIRRHFFLKRDAIIEQINAWRKKSDVASKNSAANETLSESIGDAGDKTPLNGHRSRIARYLIEELESMDEPIEIKNLQTIGLITK